MPPFVPFAPLALYDIGSGACAVNTFGRAGQLASPLSLRSSRTFRADALTARTPLLTAILSVAATLLSLRTAQLEREQQRMHRIRDELQERALVLEARNRDLADRQDYEVELATLRRTRPHRARNPR